MRKTPAYEEDYLASRVRSSMTALQKELRETGVFQDRIEYDVGAGSFQVPLSREEFLRAGESSKESELFGHVRRMGWPFAVAAKTLAESRGRPRTMEEEDLWPRMLVRLLRTIRPRYFIVARVKLRKPGRGALRGTATVEGFHPARTMSLRVSFAETRAGGFEFRPSRKARSAARAPRMDMAFYAVYLPDEN
jgi:hypothetical protein